MHVYTEIINLQKSVERRARMTAEFTQAGVAPQFFPAVHFREVAEDVLLQHCRPRGVWGRTRPGHMATTISHMKAWERFLATDASHCAIFEDDVFVAPDLGRWFADLGWWPADADIVKLEAWHAHANTVLLARPGASWGGRRVQRLLTRHMGAAGYMLTRAAARRLIDAQPYTMVIDHLLFNFNASRVAGGMTCYQVQPALVKQGNEPKGSSRMDRPDPIGRLEKIGQELRRGVLEIAYPLSSYWKLVSGAARFEKVEYRATTDQPA